MRGVRGATNEKGVEGHDKRPLTTERRGDGNRPLMKPPRAGLESLAVQVRQEEGGLSSGAPPARLEPKPRSQRWSEHRNLDHRIMDVSESPPAVQKLSEEYPPRARLLRLRRSIG